MSALLCLHVLLVWPPRNAAAGTPPLALLKAEDSRAPDSAALKTALLDPAADVRARAARAMGRVQDESYLAPLLTAFADPDARVRAEAAFAVGQIRLAAATEPPSAVTDALMGLLADTEQDVRLRALEALGKSGGRMTETLLARLLRSSEPESRREAALALARLQRQDRIAAYAPATTQALMDGLGGAPASRWACAYALSRRPAPSAARALVEAARDENPQTRLFALRALARLGRGERCQAGPRALLDADARVRVEAVGLLGACGRADRLARAAEDPSAHVRAAAATALSEAGEGLPVLRLLARDPSPLVRAEAFAGLAEKLGREAAPEIRKALHDPSWWVRSRAAFAAGRRAADAELLAESLRDDEDPRVRAAALDGLAEGGSAQAPQLVAAALEDTSSAVEYRGTAVRAAARLRSAALIGPLRAAYMNSFAHDYGRVREATVEATAALLEEHPSSKELLTLRDIILKDPAPFIRARATRLFAREVPVRPDYEPSPFLGVETASGTRVVLQTNKGEIVIALETQEAPVHAANMAALVRRKFYDGLLWYRVVTNRLVQGGDPRNSGWGDAGRFLRDEVGPRRFERGTVGMSRAAPNSGSCQFFIATVPSPQLDGEYTAFGRVVSGMEVVDLLEPEDFIRKASLP